MEPRNLLSSHRSAPNLADVLRGRGASADPHRPWRQGAVTKQRRTRSPPVIRYENPAKPTLAWRPVGSSAGRKVPLNPPQHRGAPKPTPGAVPTLDQTDLSEVLATAYVQIDEERDAAKAMIAEYEAKLATQRAKHVAELAKLQAALQAERQDKEGLAARVQQMQDKFSETHEGRVESHCQRAVRRFLRLELSRG